MDQTSPGAPTDIRHLTSSGLRSFHQRGLSVHSLSRLSRAVTNCFPSILARRNARSPSSVISKRSNGLSPPVAGPEWTVTSSRSTNRASVRYTWPTISRPVHLSTIWVMLFRVPGHRAKRLQSTPETRFCFRGAALQPSPYRDQSEVSCFSNSASSCFQTSSQSASTSCCDGDGQYFVRISSMLIFFRFLIVFLLEWTSVSPAPAAPA